MKKVMPLTYGSRVFDRPYDSSTVTSMFSNVPASTRNRVIP